MAIAARTSTIAKARVATGVRPCVPRVSMVVRAAETETTTTTPLPERALDLGAAPRGAEGYVEKDTAGQSNMYPTVMRPYEAGSSSDVVETGAANTGIAIGAAAVSLGLVAVGLLAVGGSGQPAASPADASYKTLSAYSTQFSSELGLKKALPAPVAAPEVTIQAVAVEAPVA